MAGGAQAEVDLFAVAAPERLLVEDAATVERLAGHVHAEPDPGDHLGTHPGRVPAHELGALVDARARSPNRSNASITGRGNVQIDPNQVNGVTVATSAARGRVDQSIQPTRGHHRVRVQHHHVATTGPEPLVARLHEPQVRRRGAPPAPAPGSPGPPPRRDSRAAPRSVTRRRSPTSPSAPTPAWANTLSMHPTVSSNPSYTGTTTVTGAPDGVHVRTPAARHGARVCSTSAGRWRRQRVDRADDAGRGSASHPPQVATERARRSARARARRARTAVVG